MTDSSNKIKSDFWRRESSFDNIGNECNKIKSSIKSQLNSDNRISLDSVLRATQIYDVVKETQLDNAKCLSESTRNSIWLKREDLHPVFSFKLRGAYNKMVSLTDEEKARGVAACSAGNHAQGVAYSANHLGISAKIFMPTITPPIKVDSVRRLGGEVVLTGSTFDEAAIQCSLCVANEGRVLVHPFDDLDVIAGQGLIGLEILKQHCAKLDAVFIAVGGGGLIAGVGSTLKAISPDTKIVAVEGLECPGMTESLKAGRVITLDSIGTFADGAAVKTVGNNTFNICYNGKVVDETVLVSTDEICAAIKDGFNDVRVILEPAGALAIAGMKKYIQKYNCVGCSFVAILSGANLDFNRLRFISSRADTTEHLIGVTIPEKPGIFRRMYDLVHPRSVTEFSYRITENPILDGETSENIKEGKAHVLMSYRSLAGVSDEEDFHSVKTLFDGEGMEVVDLQNCELSKVHGRHLVGGHSDAAQNEVLCRFECAERPGSLRTFLYSLPERWNVSMFHYRNHGADVNRILAGLQVPDESRCEFDVFLSSLKKQGYRCFIETENIFYNIFLRRQ